MNGFYIVTDEAETKVMDMDGYMMPSGSAFPFTTFLKSSAKQRVEKWKADMIAAGIEPYDLVIKYIE